ncbi:hypothetical protein [Luteimonas terricola]|uniref:DUF4124 domain-containing protein n=1 Tax=Luteimonas terricola TaxID=645597 RepID=A0ABQ2ENU6_9GAMM|nr:hypothetical protein [Luteimonas terricola]GGK15698.1 hypothetical protein GCM10011394_26070 [Luteimonas terricola]
MKTMHCIAGVMLVALPLAVAAQKAPTDKKLYCWDDNGVQVCGDTLPTDALDRARTEISAASGNRTGEVPRALTDDERTAAALAARAAADAELAEAERHRRDLAMVESYATESDLRRAYGERITLVEESLKTSELSLANLRQSLLSLLRQAAERELLEQPVGKALAEGIRSQHGDLLRQQGIMQRQLADRASLGSDLDGALERYRGMKGG